MASLKTSELRSALDSFADALEKNNADPTVVRGLRGLCGMFSGSETKTAAAFLKAIGQVSLSVDTPSGLALASVVPAISSFRILANNFASKDLNKSLDSLLSIMRSNADVPISGFVAKVLAPPKTKGKGKKDSPPVDDRLVGDYVARLEAVLGTSEKFDALLEELQTDARVGQAEAVAIASLFYGKTAKGTTRPKALERIRQRQAKLMKFKRQPSTSGRSAA